MDGKSRLVWSDQADFTSVTRKFVSTVTGTLLLKQNQEGSTVGLC